MDQRARHVVVAHRRARPVIGRRIGDRLHRQDAGARIIGERNAEPLAIGRRDEIAASTSRPAHRAAASRTGSRQDGQSGGSATSRSGRSAACSEAVGSRQADRVPPTRRTGGGSVVVVNSIPSKLLPGGTALNLRCREAGAMTESADLRPRSAARRRRRARGALGPATFLLDRVADDLAERLSAVLRRFERRGRSRHADRCGAPVRWPARRGRDGARRRASCGAPRERPGIGSRRRRGSAAVPRRLARPRRLGACAAVRQRPARHAGADPPRAEAGRPVPGRAARRRDADRAAPSRLPPPRPRSRAASRRASRRSPTCATSARCCSAPASRCR